MGPLARTTPELTSPATMPVLFAFVLSLLPLQAPRPALPPCGSYLILSENFEGYYAVYWNGRLVGQGTFEYDLSLSVAVRRRKNGEIEDEIGFCVGKVADHNELVIKDRAGNTIIRRHLGKREVADVLMLRRYGRYVFITPHTGPLNLE